MAANKFIYFQFKTMRKKNCRRFNLILPPLVAFNLLFIAIFNMVIDPYGILSNLGIVGENKSEIENDEPASVAKAASKQASVNRPLMTLEQRSKYRAEHFKINLANLSITSINPKTIILGTSTVLRISPNHPALTIQPAYNLGLPGGKMYDIKSYFEDTLANHPDLKQVVIGLDFFSFGGSEKLKEIASTSEAKHVTQIRKNKYSYSLIELVETNFSLDTFKASLKKIITNYNQLNQASENASQFTSMQLTESNFEDTQLNYMQISGIEYPSQVYLNNLIMAKSKIKNSKKISKKTEKNVKTLNKPIKKAELNINNNSAISNNSRMAAQFQRVILLYFNEKTLYKKYNLSQEELNNFKAIIDTCQQRNIDIRVFFAPVHAAQLEAINLSGLWSTFEEWKRQVVKIVPAWDFADYTSITTEPINDNMQNFADSVHYREQVADLILNRLYDYHQEWVPPNFGIRVTAENVESRLAHIRAERKVWLESHQATVKFVQDIKKQAK